LTLSPAVRRNLLGTIHKIRKIVEILLQINPLGWRTVIQRAEWPELADFLHIGELEFERYFQEYKLLQERAKDLPVEE
jgi:hypothetical protein